MALPDDVKTITVTGTYKNMISGAGESGYVEFLPNLKSVNSTANDVILTAPPFVAKLAQGTGFFTILLPTTDNDDFFPQSFTYTINEKVTNMGNRTTKGVRMSSALGSTASLSDILAPYLS